MQFDFLRFGGLCFKIFDSSWLALALGFLLWILVLGFIWFGGAVCCVSCKVLVPITCSIPVLQFLLIIHRFYDL